MPEPLTGDVVMADAPIPSIEAKVTSAGAVAPRSDGRAKASEQGTPQLPGAFDSIKTPVIAPNGHFDRHRTGSPLKQVQHQPSSPLATPNSSAKPVSINGNAALIIKNDKQALRLNEVLNETSPAVAREIIRKNWRTLLFDGTERDDHASFILRAGLKNATPTVIQRVLKEDGIFKEPFVTGMSKKTIINDEVLRQATPDQLNRSISTTILDRILARRLASLPAKDLIRWLAEADRLGYKHDDILDENESVRPNISSDTEDSPVQVSGHRASKDPLLLEQEKNQKIQHQQQISMQAALLQRRQQEEQRKSGQIPPNTGLTCDLCSYEFASPSGFHYHTTKKVCKKVAPSEGFKNFCMVCAQGFTTKQGMQYHQMKRVCEDTNRSKDSSIPGTSPAAPISAPKHISSPTSNPAAPVSAPKEARPFIPQPVQTPAKTQSAETSMTIPSIETPLPAGVRVSPNLISDTQRQKLNNELQAADEKYAQSLAEIPAGWSQAQKEARMISLKNSVSARKSQIRKQYGVSLRLRNRDKDAIAEATGGAAALSKKADKQNRFQAYVAPPRPTPSQVEAPTSSFSPINIPKQPQPQPQPPQRSKLNTALPLQLNQNSPTQSPSSFLLANRSQQPTMKRPRPASPPPFSYYDANPPRQPSPFVVQNAARVITIDSSSEETEEEVSRPTPRRQTGGRVDVGPTRVGIDFSKPALSNGAEQGEEDKGLGVGVGVGVKRTNGAGKGEEDGDEDEDVVRCD